MHYMCKVNRCLGIFFFFLATLATKGSFSSVKGNQRPPRSIPLERAGSFPALNIVLASRNMDGAGS